MTRKMSWRATRSIPGVRDGVYDNGMIRVYVVNARVARAERCEMLSLPEGQGDTFKDQKKIVDRILPLLPGKPVEHWQGHDCIVFDPRHPRGSDISVLAFLPGAWGRLIPVNTLPPKEG